MTFDDVEYFLDLEEWVGKNAVNAAVCLKFAALHNTNFAFEIARYGGVENIPQVDFHTNTGTQEHNTIKGHTQTVHVAWIGFPDDRRYGYVFLMAGVQIVEVNLWTTSDLEESGL